MGFVTTKKLLAEILGGFSISCQLITLFRGGFFLINYHYISFFTQIFFSFNFVCRQSGEILQQ